MKSVRYFRNTVIVNAIADLLIFIIEKKLPSGCEIRTFWASYLPAVVVAIWIVCVIWGLALAWIRLGTVSPERRRIVGRMAATLLALVLVCRLVEASVSLGTGEDPEYTNENGTLTVKKGELIEQLYLYEQKGPFYRKALRPMENAKDTDPKVTEEAYYERIRKQKLEEKK